MPLEVTSPPVECFLLHFSSVMGDNPETSFADLLAAASDFVTPAANEDVQDMLRLTSFGVAFENSTGDDNAAARADLLAGLVLLRAHHVYSGPVLPTLSAAQQERLAVALGLTSAERGAPASWPTLFAGRIIAHLAPGLPPMKRSLRLEASGVEGHL